MNSNPEHRSGCILIQTGNMQIKAAVYELDREIQMKDIDIISNDNERQTANASSNTKRRSFTWAIAAVLFLAICVILAVMILPLRNKSGADKNINESSSAVDLVEFRDPSLEREICSAMGIPGRPITKKEAQRVVSLDLSHDEESRGEITDLTGLSSFVMLEDLNLAHNRISDVSELENLSKLKRLHLEGNEISDVEPLASLTDLRLLDLEGNEISNIYTLRELTELTVFDIRNNFVADITIISNMKELKELYIRNNYIVDITPLRELEKITYLSMGENSIEDISSIAGMKNLTHLVICANSITDISVIRNFPNLVYLEIQGNRIKDYRPLKSLRKDCTVVTHW